MKNPAEFKVVQFEDGYVEGYFKDGTCLAWEKQRVTYYSMSGNRAQIDLSEVRHSNDLAQKMIEIVAVQNRHNQHYAGVPRSLAQKWTVKKVYKKYKMEEYTWQNGAIRMDKGTFWLQSDDNNARLELKPDLYRVEVSYLQRTGERRVGQGGSLMSVNPRRDLLQKYKYKYVEYPTQLSSAQIEHEYIQACKEFNIFSLPQRWYPAIKRIWSYVLCNQLIKHQFDYIDFADPDNRQVDDIKVTKMPKYALAWSQEAETEPALSTALPLYGKPNHSHRCQWIYVNSEENELMSDCGSGIMSQKYGFWMIEQGKACYNTINKYGYDYTVPLNSFPLMIRMPDQPTRSLKPHIYSLEAYLRHRSHVHRQPKQQSQPQQGGEELLTEEWVQGVGLMKAYANRMTIAKFTDKTILTLTDTTANIITAAGKSIHINLDSSHHHQFTSHITDAWNFHQRVFDPMAYNQRMQLNDIIADQRHASQVFLKVGSYFSSR